MKEESSVMGRWFGVVIVWLCTGCLSPNNDGVHHDAEEIPEHLRDMESLTVYPENGEPVYSIRFEEELTIEAGFQVEEGVEIYIGSMHPFAVDDRNRIYVYSGSTIYIFNPDGSYLRSMGGAGEGPGEFQGATNLFLTQNNLYIVGSTGNLVGN